MLQANQQTKKKQKQYVETNPVEALRDIGNTASQSIKTASKDAWNDVWSQILGTDKYSEKASEKSQKMSGELKPGQELSLAELKKQENKAKSQAETAINYHREIAEAGKTQIQKENQDFRNQVQELVSELRRLASSSKVLQKEVTAATGPTATLKPGKYHVNFFQWMISVVRDARIRVENSGAWLATMKGKQKKGLWGVAKRKGSSTELKTNVMLSGERSISTQTG